MKNSPEVDKIPSEEGSDNNKKPAENETVQNIRKFFNTKTEYCRFDKLSQAWIAAELTQEEAEKYGVTLENLRLMFKAYCEDPEFTPDPNFPKNWWSLWDENNRKEWGKWKRNRRKDTVRRFLLKSLKETLKWTAIVAGISGVVGIIFDLRGREIQKYSQAWQVINTATQQTGSGGRLEALEYLN
jgi:hypothetical protein